MTDILEYPDFRAGDQRKVDVLEQIFSEQWNLFGKRAEMSACQAFRDTVNIELQEIPPCFMMAL